LTTLPLVFAGWKREIVVRRVLKRLSRQRVVAILQPGNAWVIENGIKLDDHVEAALRTCHMRGWIEVLQEEARQGRLRADGSLPQPIFLPRAPVWKLTDSGWAAIHRTHAWELIGVLIGALSLVVAF
jgi:hypothetical protein